MKNKSSIAFEKGMVLAVLVIIMFDLLVSSEVNMNLYFILLVIMGFYRCISLLFLLIVDLISILNGLYKKITRKNNN